MPRRPVSMRRLPPPQARAACVCGQLYLGATTAVALGKLKLHQRTCPQIKRQAT